MAGAFVKTASIATEFATSATVSFSTASAAGNALIFTLTGSHKNLAGLNNPVDFTTNVAGAVFTETAQNTQAHLWTAVNIPAGTYSATASFTECYGNLTLSEISGLDNTNPVNATGGNSGLNSGSTQTATVSTSTATTVADTFTVALLHQSHRAATTPTATFTTPANYTLIGDERVIGNYGHGFHLSSRAATPTGVQTVDWGANTIDANSRWSGLLVSFNPAGSGGGGDPGGGGAIALVKSAQVKTTGSQTVAVTLNSVSAGNSLILAVSLYEADTDGLPASVTSSPALNWALDHSGPDISTVRATLYSVIDVPTSGNYTVTVTGKTTNQYTTIALAEFSGIAKTDYLDVSSSDGSSSTGVTTTGTTANTTQAAAMALAFIAVGSATSQVDNTGMVVPTGYTNIQKELLAYTYNAISFDYKLLSSTGPQSAAWGTIPMPSAEVRWSAGIVVYKAAAASGGVTLPIDPVAGPTNLYLQAAITNAVGGTLRDAKFGRSTTAAVAYSTRTTSGGTNIQLTVNNGGPVLEWVSGRSAYPWTLAGTVTFNFWAREAATSTNAGLRARLYKRTAAGVETEILPSGGSTLGYQFGSELTTTIAAKNWTGTPTSTDFATDDRLVVRFFARNIGTMAAVTGTTGATSGGGVYGTYDGPTAGASGDAYVRITEGVVFKEGEPVQTLVDDFATYNTAKWTRSSSTDVTFANGRVTIKGMVNYPSLVTPKTFSLAESAVYAQIVDPGNMSHYAYEGTLSVVFTDGFYQIMCGFSGNNLHAWVRNGASSSTGIANIPYSSALHKFLRMRETGGVVYFEHSADGSVWTQFGSLSRPAFLLDACYVQLSAGQWEGIVVGQESQFVVGGVNAIEALALAKAATLISAFDGAFDDALFTRSNTTDVTQANGLLTIKATTNYPRLNSKNLYDLTESTVYFQFANMTDLNRANCLTYIGVQGGSAQQTYEMGIGAGTFFASVRENANDATWVNNTAYVAATHRFVRLRASGSTIYFEHSPDGTNWTVFHSRTAAFSLTSVRVFIGAGQWDVATGNEVLANWDGINIANVIAGLVRRIMLIQ